MYTQDFYITSPVGNNAFSYSQRPHKQLFVPKLKEIKSFEEIELLHPNIKFQPQSSTSIITPHPQSLSCKEREETKVTFEEYDFDGKMQTCFGLKNLYALTLALSQEEREQATKKIPLYLVDNHNHVFYFWYLARQQGILSDGAILYHIDEHADMRDP